MIKPGLFALLCALCCLAVLATSGVAQAATTAKIRTAERLSTHHHATVNVHPAYTLPAHAKLGDATVAIYRGSRQLTHGHAPAVKPGRYSTVTTVTYRNRVQSTVTVPVTSSVWQPSKYDTATCTVTSWGPTTTGTNYNNNQPDAYGTLTGTCTSPKYPGQAIDDFEIWGYNDPYPSSGELIAPVDWSQQPISTYASTQLFGGRYVSVTTNTTKTVTSWSKPIKLSARRPLLVTK